MDSDLVSEDPKLIMVPSLLLVIRENHPIQMPYFKVNFVITAILILQIIIVIICESQKIVTWRVMLLE